MWNKAGMTAVALLVAACDTGGRGYQGLPPLRAEALGHSFDIRQRGDEAEAVRRNAAWLPRFGEVARAAEAAIEQATGCDVQRITGDPSVLRADLDCPG
ncbi:hypothetical protein DRV85_05480 [Rhodosalinus halophilus]|uniref:Lipoprotein n=1 Tax=Rhodosalinus halophilus TaxID=2259333 RepID=A0A365UC50_9RHOB|nr:hypothetical protein [Rhodosalinus halophilus]RBI86208.1 hypothetical protein DRV85_05480 [Rhodosalinus halophilus]